MSIMSGAHSRLLTMPMELHQQILASLPDAPSLAAAALSCRQLYAAFKDNESALVRHVLINCIGDANLPEALITHRCSPPYLSNHVKIQPGLVDEEMDAQRAYVSKFIERLERPDLDSIIIPMTEAVILGNFHVETVSVLAQRVIVDCSESYEWQKPLKESLQARPPSQTERQRIERVLYRFEMFRRLFGRFNGKWVDLVNMAGAFFSKFAPWENAQLGCIHDFLARQATPAYNYVAEHDIVWGAYEIGIHGYLHSSIQHLLTRGLSTILELARSQTFAERSRLVGGGEQISNTNTAFLHYALEHAYAYDSEEGGSPSDYEYLFDTEPFYLDGDEGPKDSWGLAREGKTYAESNGIYDDECDALRGWGYVLWDAVRVEDLEIFAQYRPLYPSRSRYDAVEASFGPRLELYEAGVRGYWSSGDEPSSPHISNWD